MLGIRAKWRRLMMTRSVVAAKTFAIEERKGVNEVLAPVSVEGVLLLSL